MSNAFVFALLYILLLLPTYFLPFLGSNSSLINGLGVASHAGLNPFFFFHMAALLALCAIAFFRGGYLHKRWLVVFPILAGVFDLVPVLSSIPLVATVMHLVTIVVGVVASAPATPTITDQA